MNEPQLRPFYWIPALDLMILAVLVLSLNAYWGALLDAQIRFESRGSFPMCGNAWRGLLAPWSTVVFWSSILLSGRFGWRTLRWMLVGGT